MFAYDIIARYMIFKILITEGPISNASFTPRCHICGVHICWTEYLHVCMYGNKLIWLDLTLVQIMACCLFKDNKMLCLQASIDDHIFVILLSLLIFLSFSKYWKNIAVTTINYKSDTISATDTFVKAERSPTNYLTNGVLIFPSPEHLKSSIENTLIGYSCSGNW